MLPRSSVSALFHLHPRTCSDRHCCLFLLQALSGGIGGALQIMMLRQPGAEDAAAQEAVRLALARCGAGGLLADVTSLATSLQRVTTVSEAVHGHVYEQLARDLL